MAMLLWIPGVLLVLTTLLLATVALEQYVLSPRAFVVRVARARRATPEHAEALVTAQLAPLLQRRG